MRLENKITDDDVMAEAARRLAVLFGARDRAHLERLISEATMEAVELVNIKISGEDWTEAQAARAADLSTKREIVKAHDAASKALRAMVPIPADYRADTNWPV